MATKREPSYTELVYQALRSARQPLTFQEIFAEVNRQRPITTRNPRATIRNALTQGKQLISLGDSRYGYLPHLLQGSLLRLPLTVDEPAYHSLIYPDDVRHALWPDFLEIQKRSARQPIHMQLPTGDEVVLPLEFFGNGVWGSAIPAGLQHYLVKNPAASGDSLLIRVVDAETGRYEASFEPRSSRDEAKIGRRNRELADAAREIFRRSPSRELPIWDLVIALLGRGCYHADVAPDPLEEVLRGDPRFVPAGLVMWMLAEDVTPEVEAVIRDRQAHEARLYGFDEGTTAASAGELSVQAARRAMERSFADIGAFLSQQEFTSIEELNARLQEMLATGGVPRRTAETPLEKAQDLMYEAWEAPQSRERVRLAKQALEISPDCADAYVLLAEETARSPKEAADLYAKGVAAGERALGTEAFEENAGHFWGIVETRPYMRARLGLAEALWAMGRRQEAIAHAWDLLRLNPGDNQGVRYLLLNWLLETGDDAQVKTLLDRYPEDASAIWLYGSALHAFRTEGDTKHARGLRAEAERQNPHVLAYLSGRKRLPRNLPDTMGFGDETEAIACAVEQMAVWHGTPGALAWLEKPSR